MEESIHWLPIKLLDEHPYNGIFNTNEEELQKLIASIKSCGGIIDPLIVQPRGDRYLIIAGNRRKLAAERLGHEMVPCRFLPEGADSFNVFLESNLTQRDKTPMQIARVIRAWKQVKGIKRGGNRREKSNCNDCSLTEILGMTERTLFMYDKLNELIPELQECVDAGVISIALGERLASYSPEVQKTLFNILGEDISKIPLKEVRKLKEETDRGYLVLEVLQKKLSELEAQMAERARKEGEIGELEKRVSQLKAKIRALNYDLIDRQSAAERLAQKTQKSGAALLDVVERVARPVAKARPEIEALLMTAEIEKNSAAHLMQWAQVLSGVGQALEAAARKALIAPVKSEKGDGIFAKP